MRRTAVPKNPMTRKALTAMRDAVAKVVEDHRQRHMPLAIWQDGKVVRIQPDQVSIVREAKGDYRVSRRRRSR
jgi:hypothetical protein